MEDAFLKLFFAFLETALDVFGPALIRQHTLQRIDEWEAARIPSNVAFKAQFGKDP